MMLGKVKELGISKVLAEMKREERLKANGMLDGDEEEEEEELDADAEGLDADAM